MSESKTERVSLETKEGYVANMIASTSIDGVVVVKASTVFKGFNTPGIVLLKFEGKTAMADAVSYMKNVKAAILNEPLEEN